MKFSLHGTSVRFVTRRSMLGRQAHRQLCMLSLNCISASPAALNRYLAPVPAMSLIPFAPFFDVGLTVHGVIELREEVFVLFLAAFSGKP